MEYMPIVVWRLADCGCEYYGLSLTHKNILIVILEIERCLPRLRFPYKTLEDIHVRDCLRM